MGLTLLLPSANALATDEDLCALRPDLCDSETVSSTRGAARQGRFKRTAEARKKRSRAATSKRRRCLQPEERQDLNYERLPLCGSQAAFAADNAIKENAGNPLVDAPPAPNLRAARTPASTIDFDTYIRKNAGHPAFASRTAKRQTAFHQAVRTILPLPDTASGSMREDSAAANNSSEGAPAGAANGPAGLAPTAQDSNAGSFSRGY